MTAIDPNHLLDILRQAAVVINEVYATPFDVAYKGPGDPVTLADRRANDLIVSLLEAAYPGVPIVAEESDASRYAHFRGAETIFFVDPLDGTREFVKRNGEFVTMVGVVENERPTIGVILRPTTAEACVGVVGQGTKCVRPDGTWTPARVSSTDRLAEARLVASRSGDQSRYELAQQKLGVHTITPLGSAGMKGLAIARAEADAYVAPFYAGKRWDACALEAVVVAAGGHVTDAHGEPLDYRGPSLVNDRGIICSGKRLHEKLVAVLERERQPGGILQRDTT